MGNNQNAVVVAINANSNNGANNMKNAISQTIKPAVDSQAREEFRQIGAACELIEKGTNYHAQNLIALGFTNYETGAKSAVQYLLDLAGETKTLNYLKDPKNYKEGKTTPDQYLIGKGIYAIRTQWRRTLEKARKEQEKQDAANAPDPSGLNDEVGQAAAQMDDNDFLRLLAQLQTYAKDNGRTEVESHLTAAAQAFMA